MYTPFKAVDKVVGAGLFFEFSSREVSRGSGADFKKRTSVMANY